MLCYYCCSVNTDFQTTFIPGETRTAPKAPRSSFPLFVALFIFFTTIALCGALTLYRANVEQQLAAKEADIASRESLINIEQLRDLQRVSDRLAVAEELVRNHNAFSVLLPVLEEATLQSVTLDSLSFRSSDGAPQLDITGVAPSYMSLYVQEEAFRKHAGITEVKLTAMDRDSVINVGDVVKFRFALTLKPDLILYRTHIQQKQEAPKTTPEDVVSPEATTPNAETVAPQSSPIPES